MATKWDDPCLEKAKDTEPIFTLLGRDMTAPIVVVFWILLQMIMEVVKGGGTRLADGRLLEAVHCALAMRKWPSRKLAD